MNVRKTTDRLSHLQVEEEQGGAAEGEEQEHAEPDELHPLVCVAVAVDARVLREQPALAEVQAVEHLEAVLGSTCMHATLKLVLRILQLCHTTACHTK